MKDALRAGAGSALAGIRGSARDRYIAIFGGIDSLAQPISWSTGVSNMLEWLTWSTNDVLGVTKTRYWRKIVEWCDDKVIRNAPFERKLKFVDQKLQNELRFSEKYDRYAAPASAIASPREVLRRAKFFSEDYLNKEFDIFWSLVSDKYLDKFYRQFTQVKGGGRWATHGNGGLFATSTGIREMQMDNLSYNEHEGLLVANELKLGGSKNPDQILKYALMFKMLREKKFILPQTRFLVLFINDKKAEEDWQELIEAEVRFCEKSKKSTARIALQPEVMAIAKRSEYATTSWADLMEFNNNVLTTLDPATQQVEWKLLSGFNESLAAKARLRT